jgi:2-methylcitrate dehydratase PrpD
MNTGFCVAMRLIEGDVFVDQMVEENIARPDLVTLANRVKMVRSVEREQRGNEYRKGVDMQVLLKDGKMLKKTVDFALGNDRRPLTGEQMATKFRRLAAKALASGNVAEIEKIIWDLERTPAVTPLIKALRGKTAAA